MLPAIRVENLSKQYKIGLGKQGEYRTLRESLTHAVTAPLRRFRQLTPRSSRSADPSLLAEHRSDTFWALKDVSFDVQPGDVVGIIGRNGAGKSTLLKILSRIVEPTDGRVEISGRVASLLEVGTGFHPELTGRENIYMNGAILGMTRREISHAFDKIVEFSGVEKFLDTPIKRYSSGMQVRLAFSVAAHLNPEILIIDEVLAVGDSEFQERCLGKMEDVAQSGRTVIFVSHNMPTVRRLTQRVCYLNQGKVVSVGATNQMIDRYLADTQCKRVATGKEDLDFFRRDRTSDSPVRFARIFVDGECQSEEIVPQLSSGEPIAICFEIHACENIGPANLSVMLLKDYANRVTTLFSCDQNVVFNIGAGKQFITCRINSLPLSPGSYSITCGLNRGIHSKAFDVIVDFPLFEIRLLAQESGEIDWLNRPWGGVHWKNVDWELNSL